ncbi:MAG: ABC transporter substrate-binding protein [Pseudomonadota bacterium]
MAKGLKIPHVAAVFLVGMAIPASAADLVIATGVSGGSLELLRKHLGMFEERTGHNAEIVTMPPSTTEQFAQYRIWLSAQNPDIDVYTTDVIWAGQLAAHFVDLSPAAADVVDQHIPAIVESQTIDGRLVALPQFTDAPALYYRTDLLEKYGKTPPETWTELEATAREIMEAERAAGNDQLWGYVFQGAAYEGLTTNVLEWVASNGGGTFVDADGEITADNPQAIEALDMAAGWVDTIAPPGVLAYKEEEARGAWQTGNAVFMRNWPYAYSLGNGEESAIRGKFDTVRLPIGPSGEESAATLGGWNLAVSQYSSETEAATELAMFLASAEIQKDRAVSQSVLPTITALYEDPDIAKAQPIVTAWRPVVEGAVARPSAQTKADYNEVSSEVWTAAHATLSGTGDAAENLGELERRLKRIRGRGW